MATALTDFTIERLWQNALTGASEKSSTAVEACAGMWGRALAMSDVNPSSFGLGATELNRVGRALVKKGEALFYIRRRMEQIRLIPVSTYDIWGSSDENPEMWVYHINLPAPNGVNQIKAMSGDVLHFRYAPDDNAPWRGVSPLENAKSTLDLLNFVERRMREEYSSPINYVIPHQRVARQEDIQSLDAAFQKGGCTVLIEESANPNRQNPDLHRQFEQKRLGCTPIPEYRELHRELSHSVLAACGISPTLMDDGGDGTGQREAWRRFVFTTITPISKMIEDEVSEKLGPVELRFSELHASDITSRARALGQMVTAGMSLEEAKQHTGFQHA